MRIPAQLLKSVAFVSEDQEHLDYRASAFIVSVPHDDNSGVLHLVTAKHVAARLRDGAAVLGFNGKDGLPLWMMNGAEVPWFFHPDETIDVAILPMASLRLKEYDYQDISTTMFVTPEQGEKCIVGIGDETFTVGLFAPFIGTLRFTPIIKTGAIAMMPDGRVHHPTFGGMEAYLIESRSIGGLSGSPVFVRDTVMVQSQNQDGERRPFWAPSGLHFLGMLSGHWNTPSTNRHAELNMGVSLVVPAVKILEALFAPELTALREEAFNRGINP